jgi:hypothetical protein
MDIFETYINHMTSGDCGRRRHGQIRGFHEELEIFMDFEPGAVGKGKKFGFVEKSVEVFNDL